MPQSGKLKVWNEARGFGFVAPSDGSADVFVHISAFPREGPRPVAGETLLFDIGPGKDGKPRVARVHRPGQLRGAADATRGERRRYRESRPAARAPLVGWLVTVLLLGALGAFGHAQYSAWRDAQTRASLPVSAQVPASSSPPVGAACDGRTHCSQMTSCREAKYFLKHCPGVQMDGNNDGVPCEQQWCTSPWAD